VKVFLAGEGRHELGDWEREPQYRSSPPEIGLVEALLRRVRGEGWDVIGAVKWKDIRKLRAGEFRTAEMRNVHGAALHAQEAGADVLAFTRDRDGRHEREREIERAIAELVADNRQVIGGVASQQIEAWVLALLGESRTELLSDSKGALEERGRGDLQAMLEIIAASDIKRATDAESLTQWLHRAELLNQ
jgi:hypothetical protein